MSRTVIVTSANEFWPFNLVAWRFRKSDVVVAEVRPFVPLFLKPLTAFVNWAVRRGAASNLTDVHPSLRRYAHFMGSEYETDIFRRVEPWMTKYFCFEKMETVLPGYSYAYQHVTSNFIQKRLKLPVLAKGFLDVDDSPKRRFSGFEPEVSAMIAEFIDDPMISFAPRGGWLNRVCNAACGLMYLIATIRYIILRISGSGRPSVSSVMAADFTGDRYDRQIYEACGGEKDVLLVPRDAERSVQAKSEYPGYKTVATSAGCYSKRESLSTLGAAFADTWRIFGKCGHCHPEQFRSVAKLTYKRMAFRGFLNRFDFRMFWARDDYNPEHIIRSQELRRAGRLSMGRIHGFPILAAFVPHNRCIDFDYYFIFGRHLYEKYYKAVWPPYMRVIPVGTFAMTPEITARLKQRKPNNILIFLKVGYWPPDRNELLDQFVYKTAAAFPDRKIIVKFKGTNFFPFSKISPDLEPMIDRWEAKLDNIIIAKKGQDTYEDLFFMGSYVISDPSSISAEAIPFGLHSFAINFEGWTSLIFRDFPALCVNSPEEVIDRIQCIERGDWHYPRETFEPLIAMPDQPVAQHILSQLD